MESPPQPLMAPNATSGGADVLAQQLGQMSLAPPGQTVPLQQALPHQQQGFFVNPSAAPQGGFYVGQQQQQQQQQMLAGMQQGTSPGNSRSSATGRRQSDKSLFVSGLHPNCEFTHLHERFQLYGKLISCRVLRDAKTGNSRCIGYVNFAHGADAARAVAEENGKAGPQGGGAMSIRYAEDDPAFTPEETKKLFVRYVPMNATTEQVRVAYSKFGTVTECSVMPDISSAAKAEAEPWSMAYVTFSSAEEATLACAKSHRSFLLGDRHELAVKPAESLATRAQRQRKHDGSASSRGGSISAHNSTTGGMGGFGGSGSASQPMQQGMAGPPPVQQHQHVPQQIVVPPGYQLAYLPGAHGAMTPVLIPVQQQQPQPQQQQHFAFAPQGQQQQQQPGGIFAMQPSQ